MGYRAQKKTLINTLYDLVFLDRISVYINCSFNMRIIGWNSWNIISLVSDY